MLEISRNQVSNQQVSPEQTLVLPLSTVRIAEISLVGGKNASLGEMIQLLRLKGVRVPNGFATK